MPVRMRAQTMRWLTSHGMNADERVDSLDGDALAVGIVRVGVRVRRAVNR